MTGMRGACAALICALALATLPFMNAGEPPRGAIKSSPRSRDVVERVGPSVRKALSDNGFVPGSAVYIRIFKEERVLEVWMPKGKRYGLAFSWPIAAMSGHLGPKEREGDKQAPEGFYTLTPASFNPTSNYHLSFDIGYPNVYDRLQGRTGSFIMIHGGAASIGCFAMTDPVIEKLWVTVLDAMRAGHASIPVHIFPFRMHEANMARFSASPWMPFWRQCQKAYAAFETTGIPPEVEVVARTYRVAPVTGDAR